MEAECNINDNADELIARMGDLTRCQNETGHAVMLKVDECGNVVARLMEIEKSPCTAQNPCYDSVMG